MKVFVSWSGDQSGKVAELLNDWLPCVIQNCDPWLSKKDIDRGANWNKEIMDQLASSSLGIVCLTKLNVDSPWVLFESGAIAKGLESSRVYTFLVGMGMKDVPPSNPLFHFNHTLPDKNGLYSLLESINKELGEKRLKEKTLRNTFETFWPQFEEKYREILKAIPVNDKEDQPEDKDILNELAGNYHNIMNGMAKLDVAVKTLMVETRQRNLDTWDDSQTISRRRFSRKLREDMDELRASQALEDAVLEAMKGGASNEDIKEMFPNMSLAKLNLAIIICRARLKSLELEDPDLDQNQENEDE